jgi:hypothetical protein
VEDQRKLSNPISFSKQEFSFSLFVGPFWIRIMRSTDPIKFGPNPDPDPAAVIVLLKPFVCLPKFCKLHCTSTQGSKVPTASVPVK